MDTGINALLVLAGVGAILSAIVGGGIVIGGLTIPRVAHPRLRAAICSVGVVFLVLGVGLQTGLLKEVLTRGETRRELRAAYVQDLLGFCQDRHELRQALIDKGWRRSDDPDEFGRFLSRLAEIEADWNRDVTTVEGPPGDQARLNELYDPLYLRVRSLRAASRAADDRHSIPKANALLEEAYRLGLQFDEDAKSYGFGNHCPVTSGWVSPRRDATAKP